MIKHIVMWKFKEGEQENMMLFRERLLALKGQIPEIRSMEVGVNINPSERSYDAVLVSVGAEPVSPPVPGLAEIPHATMAYGQEEALKGKRVAIIGGGLIGVETGLHLAQKGASVSIIEMQPELCPDASRTQREELIEEIAAEANCAALTGAHCTAVRPASVTYVKDGMEQTLTVDAVYQCAGLRAKTEEADAFIGSAPIFAEIGDCVKPGTTEEATRTAWYAAMNL